MSSSLFIKGVSEALKNEAKEQKDGILGMLLDARAASLLGNTSESKEATETRAGKGTIKLGKSTIRAGQDF